ncbi:hypothetical protein BAE44_0016927, partial [Dichanthelium oligosanthes]
LVSLAADHRKQKYFVQVCYYSPTAQDNYSHHCLIMELRWWLMLQLSEA